MRAAGPGAYGSMQARIRGGIVSGSGAMPPEACRNSAPRARTRGPRVGHSSDGERASGFLAIFTACEDEHAWSESYIVVPRKRGGHYLFTIAGQGKSQDAVKSAGNLFRQAVFQVLPGE